jgi:hypothetical protein
LGQWAAPLHPAAGVAWSSFLHLVGDFGDMQVESPDFYRRGLGLSSALPVPRFGGSTFKAPPFPPRLMEVLTSAALQQICLDPQLVVGPSGAPIRSIDAGGRLLLQTEVSNVHLDIFCGLYLPLLLGPHGGNTPFTAELAGAWQLRTVIIQSGTYVVYYIVWVGGWRWRWFRNPNARIVCHWCGGASPRPPVSELGRWS